MRRNVLTHGRRIERTGHSEGPRERPAPLGEGDALRIAMQPGTAAGCAATWIWHRTLAPRNPGERV